jgi:hypothetical protein
LFILKDIFLIKMKITILHLEWTTVQSLIVHETSLLSLKVVQKLIILMKNSFMLGDGLDQNML